MRSPRKRYKIELALRILQRMQETEGPSFMEDLRGCTGVWRPVEGFVLGYMLAQLCDYQYARRRFFHHFGDAEQDMREQDTWEITESGKKFLLAHHH